MNAFWQQICSSTYTDLLNIVFIYFLANNNHARSRRWLGIDPQRTSSDNKEQSRSWYNILTIQGNCYWDCQVYW